jgi:hypothetical protein
VSRINGEKARAALHRKRTVKNRAKARSLRARHLGIDEAAKPKTLQAPLAQPAAPRAAAAADPLKRLDEIAKTPKTPKKKKAE